MKASARIKEKRLGRFSTLDLSERFRAVRDLQRARSAKFPALKSAQTGRCGVSPPEGAARNKVRARGRLSPFVKLILLKLDVRTFI